MGKGRRLKGQKKGSGKSFLKEFSDLLTASFQRELRKSELVKDVAP